LHTFQITSDVNKVTATWYKAKARHSKAKTMVMAKALGRMTEAKAKVDLSRIFYGHSADQLNFSADIRPADILWRIMAYLFPADFRMCVKVKPHLAWLSGA